MEMNPLPSESGGPADSLPYFKYMYKFESTSVSQVEGIVERVRRLRFEENRRRSFDEGEKDGGSTGNKPLAAAEPPGLSGEASEHAEETEEEVEFELYFRV